MQRVYGLRNCRVHYGLFEQQRTRGQGTPFNLTFGADTVILVEIGINSLRVAYCDPEQNEANLRANLDLLEKIREEASVKATARQMRVIQYFNKQIKAKAFEKGDLVLRNCRASRPVGEQKKLSPTWEGSYLVFSVIGKGAIDCKQYKARIFQIHGMHNI